MSETINSILNRYSCRKYLDKPVLKEQINTILKCALASPSARNKQPWQIIVLKNEKIIKLINSSAILELKNNLDSRLYNKTFNDEYSIFFNAKLVFIICSLKDEKNRFIDVDTGIVAQNICLASTALGLGNCQIGLIRYAFISENKDILYEKLKVDPSVYEIKLSVVVGYADEHKLPHELDFTKIIEIG